MPIADCVALAHAPSGFRALNRLARGRPALSAALAVAVLVAAAQAVTHHAPSLVIPRAAAVRDVLRAGSIRDETSGLHWTRAEAFPIDTRREQVNLYRGGRVVLEAVVAADGVVEQAVDPARQRVPYGNPIAFRGGVLAGLALLFVLFAGVMPLWRLRNLDVAALLALTAPAVLLQHRMIAGSVIAALVPLAYLALRCARIALGAAREPQPSTPVFDAVCHRLSARERRSLLRLLGGAVGVVFLMVCVSSTAPVDVILAVMEGATKLLHGVLPYGHMPGDIIHGDTYPLLSYALYVPLAAVSPVDSTWSSVDIALGVTAVAAVLAAAGAGALVARERPGPGTGAPRAALAVLCFPALLAIASSGTTDVPLGAMLLGSVLLWRRPAMSTGVLAVAGWFKLVPFALVPIWLAAQRGRRRAAPVAAILVVSIVCLGTLLGLGGTAGLAAMIHAIGYQLSRGAFQSPWHALGLDALQPYGLACAAGLIAGAAVRVRRDRVLAADPIRIAALAAAVLIVVELAANYWAFLYLAWIEPLIVLVAVAGPAAVTVPARAVREAGDERRAPAPGLGHLGLQPQ